MFKRLLVLLSIFIVLPVLHASEILISFDSSNWALECKATGKVTESYPDLYIHLDRLSMKPNPVFYKSPIKVNKLYVQLLRYKENERERVVSSNYYVVNEILSEDEEKILDNLRLLIPIQGLNNLKDYWLMFSVEIQGEDGLLGYIYADSQKNLFEDKVLLSKSEVSTTVLKQEIHEKGEGEIMGIIAEISPFISALAALGIFFFTWLNFAMYKRIKNDHSEQQQRFSDLLEAIVIATLINSNEGAYPSRKNIFKGEYKGETQIFKEEK